MALLILGSAAVLLNSLNPASLKASQALATAKSLQLAREALLGYAITFRESHPNEGYGYFPCPDTHDGSDPAQIGTADTSCGAAGNMAIGLLPYKTLGLTDIRDSSGECLWYAVAGGFKNNPKSDPLNWDTQGNLTIQDASGINELAKANDSAGGVAIIIFAPGSPLDSQQTGKNVLPTPCRSDPAQPALYLEYINNPFRQGPGVSAAGVTLLNDQLSWLSNADVFERIRMRSDFSNYLNTGIQSIKTALSLSAPLPAPLNDGLPGVPPSSLTSSERRFYLQWQDQFRYLKCAATTPYCYQVGAQNCDGILIFSGEHSTGRPRPMNGRALADYFESPTKDLPQGGPGVLSTFNMLYDTTSLLARSRDIVACLRPSL